MGVVNPLSLNGMSIINLYALVRLLFVVVLASSFSGFIIAEDGLPLQKRVMLDEEFLWLNPNDADDILDRIGSAGFNVFVPVIWHGRGVSWNSKLAGKEPRWTMRAASVKDPLKVLIEKAHKKNIEVHPWFTVVLRQRDIFPEFHEDGVPKKAFNVHDKNYRDFIIELMLEVVRNYNIDGVNLDYIRSMGNCMTAACLADYYDKTGRDLKRDSELQWKDAVSSKHIGEWNEPPITDIVKRFSEQARKIKPNLVISVDTHPENSRLKREGVRAIKWANSGYIDLIYDMQYGKTIDVASFKKAKSKLNNPKKIALMIGNFERPVFRGYPIVPRASELFVEHVDIANELAVDSGTMAVYEYLYLSDAQVEALKSVSF